MKCMKRLITGALVISCCISFLSVSSSASQFATFENTEITMTEVSDHISSTMQALKQAPEAFQFTEQELSEAYIGSSFKIYEAEEKNVFTVYYPIISKNNIIGFSLVHYIDHEISVSISKRFSVRFDNVLKKDSGDWVLIVQNDNYYVANNEIAYPMLDENVPVSTVALTGVTNLLTAANGYHFSFKSLCEPENAIQLCTKNKAVQADFAASNGYSILEEYQIIPQRDESGSIRNICWAAVMASIMRFEKPGAYGITTAWGIANAFEDYSDRNVDEVKPRLDFFLSSMLNTTVYYRAFTQNEIVNTIQNNHPAFIACENANNPEGMGHAVALCGYIPGDGQFWVRIMDPRRETFDIQEMNGNDFTFDGISGNSTVTYRWVNTIGITSK